MACSASGCKAPFRAARFAPLAQGGIDIIVILQELGVVFELNLLR